MEMQNTQRLREAIRDLVGEMLTEGPVDPAAFVLRFRERHGELISECQDFITFDWLANSGKNVAKRRTNEALRRRESEMPDMFPESIKDLDIDSSLVVPVGQGRGKWVRLEDATLSDGNAHGDVLKQNAKACMAKLTDWAAFWNLVRPLLEEHPDWRIGDALRQLARNEKNR